MIEEGALLGATSSPSFSSLINAMSSFLRVWTNATGNDTTSASFLGQAVDVVKFRAYLIDFLPAIFAIIGTVIAINLAIKAFKKFSR